MVIRSAMFTQNTVQLLVKLRTTALDRWVQLYAVPTVHKVSETHVGYTYSFTRPTSLLHWLALMHLSYTVNYAQLGRYIYWGDYMNSLDRGRLVLANDLTAFLLYCSYS